MSTISAIDTTNTTQTPEPTTTTATTPIYKDKVDYNYYEEEPVASATEALAASSKGKEPAPVTVVATPDSSMVDTLTPVVIQPDNDILAVDLGPDTRTKEEKAVDNARFENLLQTEVQKVGLNLLRSNDDNRPIVLVDKEPRQEIAQQTPAPVIPDPRTDPAAFEAYVHGLSPEQHSIFEAQVLASYAYLCKTKNPVPASGPSLVPTSVATLSTRTSSSASPCPCSRCLYPTQQGVYYLI
ncbi:hypothetical protein HK102_007780 [Quaeritorhiza haematococci]|nr:hypothetical protein HK102_007780 [Quaeritorhiza haematococci]